MSERANSRRQMGPRLDRRHFLAVCGASLLAGCPSDGERSDGETAPGARDGTAADDTATQSGTSGGDGTATGPTETGTQAPWADSGTSLDERDGGPPAVTTGWQTFGYDLANTGSPPTDTPATDDLGLYWRHYIDGQYSVPQPAIVGDTIFTGSGRFAYALDLRDGSERWAVDLGKYMHNVSPTVSDGLVYLAAREVSTTDQVRDTGGTFYALNVDDASVEWTVDAHAMAGAPVHDGTLFLPSTPTEPTQRGVLRALDAATGEEQWRFEVKGKRDGAETAVYSTPAIDTEDENDTLYLTSASAVGDDERGFLHAIDPATGEQRWRKTTPGGARVAPVCADGRVYVGDETGRLTAFSTGGVEVWQKPVGDGGIDAAPVVAPEQDAVCVTSLGRFASLSPSTGEVNWEKEIRDVRRAGLATAGEALYVGGSPFLIVDLATGEIERRLPVDGVGGAYGQPVVSDGAVYVTSCIKQGENLLYDNYVYVIG